MSRGSLADALARRRAHTAGADTGQVRSLRRRGMSPLRAAAVALVAITVACYLAFGGGLPWAHEYTVKAVVSSAEELGPRSPVRIAGVDVGHVASVRRGPGSAATITLALNRTALPLHTDATLKIRPRLFLEGNFFVDLQPGTPAAPVLHEGGTIPLPQTAVAVQLDQVLTALQSSPRQNLQQLVHGLATQLEDGGAQAVHDLIPLMRPAFLPAAITAQALQGQQPDDLGAFLGDAGRVSGALASRRVELPGLVTNLDLTLTTLASRSASLAATVGDLDQVVSASPPTFDALNRLFPSARVFAVSLRPALAAAPATLALANPFLDQAGRLTSAPELPALLAQLKPAIGSLRVLQPQLGSLLSILRPVTECLRVNAVPTLLKQVPDGALSSGQPVYRDFLDSLVGLAGGSQNFDGDGQAVRYHAGAGDETVSTGDVPGLGAPLAGVEESPIIGSRPRYTGQLPPFRPDVACVSQRPPSLTAETGAAPAQRPLP